MDPVLLLPMCSTIFKTNTFLAGRRADRTGSVNEPEGYSLYDDLDSSVFVGALSDGRDIWNNRIQ